MVEKINETGERVPTVEVKPVVNEAGDQSKTYQYCVECGTKIEKTDNFCGNCGYNRSTNGNGYPNNVQHSNINGNNQNYYQPPTYAKPPKPGLDWKPIVIGGFSAFGINLLLSQIAGSFMWGLDIYTILGIFTILGFLSLFLGGLVAGVFAKHSGGTHGMYAGLVCALIIIPINIISGFPVGFLSIIFAILLNMLFGGLGGLVGFYATKSRKMSPSPYPQAIYW